MAISTFTYIYTFSRAFGAVVSGDGNDEDDGGDEGGE